MARNKISITEALQVLRDNNLQVSITPVIPDEEPEVVKPVSAVRKVGKTAVTITLFAKHSLGSGGSMVVDKTGQKGVCGNEYVNYGPGVVTVPVALASQLLYQDELAKRADNNMLDPNQKFFLIMERRQGSKVAHVPVQVDSGFLNGFGVHMDKTMTI